MPALSSRTLPQLSASVATPRYDRTRLRDGIVHLGVGGFHRSHQAAYPDRLMADGRALDRAIYGAGVLPRDRRMAEVMADQAPLEDVGVRVVGDVEPYELMTLRLLDGSPQAMAYLGVLSGRARYAEGVGEDGAPIRWPSSPTASCSATWSTTSGSSRPPGRRSSWCAATASARRWRSRSARADGAPEPFAPLRPATRAVFPGATPGR